MQLPRAGLLRNIALAAAFATGWPVLLAALNFHLVGTPNWLLGGAAGAAIAWAWTRAGGLRAVLIGLSLFLFIAVAGGWIPVLQDKQQGFMQGMSLGFPLGILFIGWIERRRTHAWLKEMCMLHDDQAGLEWLARHVPKQ